MSAYLIQQYHVGFTSWNSESYLSGSQQYRAAPFIVFDSSVTRTKMLLTLKAFCAGIRLVKSEGPLMAQVVGPRKTYHLK